MVFTTFWCKSYTILVLWVGDGVTASPTVAMAITWVPDSDSSSMPAPTPTTGSLVLLLSSADSFVQFRSVIGSCAQHGCPELVISVFNSVRIVVFLAPNGACSRRQRCRILYWIFYFVLSAVVPATAAI